MVGVEGRDPLKPGQGRGEPLPDSGAVPLRQPDRSSFVELNRTRLRLWDWGDPSAPPVICLHGAYDHGRMWDGLAPELAALGYRVVAPDLRGHGDSGRLSSGAAWAAVALDVALLARHLGPPVGVVGHSFGGGQALYVAGVWPELVRWVVNLDGLGPPPAALVPPDDPAALTADLLAGADRVLPRRPRVHPSAEALVARRRAVNGRMPEEWLEHLVRHGTRPAEGGLVWKADPVFGVGLPAAFDLDALHAEHEVVTCPVLALTGAEHDTWSEMTPDEVDDRLTHLPTARHHVVDGAGHYVHLERPDAVVAEVAAFLDEVGP
jgi:pimeloyl-ACP methyl ester carboxylesterase